MTDLPIDAGGVVEPPYYTHVFTLPDGDLFKFRAPAQWLDDVLSYAYRDMYAIEATGREGTVQVAAKEAVLRFVCVVLNQHAAQSPGDPTPEAEAARLEATLAGALTPQCPSCGARRWKVDTDVTVRAAIIVGTDPEFWFDKLDGAVKVPDNDTGAVSCHTCAWEPSARSSNAAERQIVRAVLVEAWNVANRSDWNILTDYRQF